MAKRSFDAATQTPHSKLWENLTKASEAALRLEAEMQRRVTVTGSDGRTRKVLAHGPEGHDLNADRIASSFAAVRQAELALFKALSLSEAEEHQDWQTAEFTRQAEDDLAAVAASLGIDLTEGEGELSEAEEQRFCPVSDRWASWSGDYDWSEAPVLVEEQDDLSVGEVADWLLADLS